MSKALIAALASIGLAAGVARAVMGGMLREEAQMGIAAFVAFHLDHEGGISNPAYAAIFVLIPLSGVVVAAWIRPWIRSHNRQARAIHDVLYPRCTGCFPAKTAGQGSPPRP